MKPHAIVGLQDHTCNAWCTAPAHVHLVLVTPEAEAKDIVHGPIAEAYYALHGRRILSAHPAREEDRTSVLREKAGRPGINTALMVQRFWPTQLQAMRCWLITFTTDAS